MARVVIDPGHGGVSLNGDTGTIDPNTGNVEAYANYLLALTLKHYLTRDGHSVELTRTADVDVDNGERVKDRGADVLVSVHFDSPDGRALIYYPGVNPDPRTVLMAQTIGAALGVPVRSSTTSRFAERGLYIDRATCPAFIWEVDRLVDFVPDKEYRIDKVLAFKDALYDAMAVLELPEEELVTE